MAPDNMSRERESTRNRRVATNVAKIVKDICEETKYVGQNPYRIEAIDMVENTAYIIEIRQGQEEFDKPQNWITLMVEEITNQHLVRSYLLKQQEKFWKYDDSYWIKYKESSVPKLEQLQQRLARYRDSLQSQEALISPPHSI